MSQKETRRNFFKKALMGLAILPIAKIAYASATFKKVVVGKGMAKKLEFVLKSTKTDTCSSCKWFKMKKTKDESKMFAPCTMLGGKYVPTTGWCKKYKKIKA